MSLTWLASHTQRIEFGPLVSPVSFRHPTHTARMACAVDDLSGGRLTLGLGAGWQAREHDNYGWDLLPVGPRFDRFEEGLQVITGLLRSDAPLDFAGQYYRLKEAVVLPRPARPAGPPICIGGNGPRRTLPLTARFADEWNGIMMTAEDAARLGAKLDGLLEAAGRKPSDVRRSMMVGTVFGRDQAQLSARLGQRSADELRARGVLVGTPSEFVDQLGALAGAGLQRVMIQWLDLDDIDGLEVIAAQVLPQLAR